MVSRLQVSVKISLLLFLGTFHITMAQDDAGFLDDPMAFDAGFGEFTIPLDGALEDASTALGTTELGTEELGPSDSPDLIPGEGDVAMIVTTGSGTRLDPTIRTSEFGGEKWESTEWSETTPTENNVGTPTYSKMIVTKSFYVMRSLRKDQNGGWKQYEGEGYDNYNLSFIGYQAHAPTGQRTLAEQRNVTIDKTMWFDATTNADNWGFMMNHKDAETYDDRGFMTLKMEMEYGPIVDAVTYQSGYEDTYHPDGSISHKVWRIEFSNGVYSQHQETIEITFDDLLNMLSGQFANGNAVA